MAYKLIKVGKVWHYRFQVDGVRVQRSTRESVKSRADAIASKVYEDTKVWARGKSPVPTLRDLCWQWIDVNASVVSKRHTSSVKTFARLHLYDLADLPIDKITTAAVEKARNAHLIDHEPSSVNQWLAYLKLVMNWAVKREVIPMLPWRVRMLKVQRKPRVILPATSTKQWLHELDNAATTPSVGLAVRLMLALGLRASEAASARWEWIDWERRTYTPGITKGREADPVPMPDWLLEILHEKRCHSGLIAPDDDGAMLREGFARDAMRQANKAIGLGRLTPHRLRGTFATMLSEAGVPIQTIQRVLRHKDPMTTMKYLEKNLDLAVTGQQRIAEKIGMVWRESGEQNIEKPHEI